MIKINKNEEGSVLVFREITDKSITFKNTSINIKIIRIFIRLSQNIFPFSLTIRIYRSISFFLSIFLSNNHPWIYILSLNTFRLRYLTSMANENFYDALAIKNEWSQFVIKVSTCSENVDAAKNFINLVKNDKFHELDRISNSIIGLLGRNFYISGPSNHYANDIDLGKFSSVHLKPFSSDLSVFKENILFLNSYYYRKKLLKDKALQGRILKSYDRIFVFCRVSKMLDGFERLDGLAQGDISSPMGLSRVLVYLAANSDKNAEYIIDGFDLFLSENPYMNNYYKNKDHLATERNICLSLIHHDPLYNFLYLKKLAKEINLRNSSKFEKVLALSMNEYIAELFKIRDFRTVSK